MEPELYPLTDDEYRAITLYAGASSQILAAMLLQCRVDGSGPVQRVLSYNRMLAKVREVR